MKVIRMQLCLCRMQMLGVPRQVYLILKSKSLLLKTYGNSSIFLAVFGSRTIGRTKQDELESVAHNS